MANPTPAEQKAASFFDDFDANDIDETHSADTGRTEFGPIVQWFNGTYDRKEPEPVQFGGFEISLETLERFQTEPITAYNPFDVPHSKGRNRAYIAPFLNLAVCETVWVYESHQDGKRRYSLKKGEGEGRLFVFAYVQEFLPVMSRFTPMIFTLKGTQAAQYFKLKREFDSEILSTAKALIDAKRETPLKRLPPSYLCWFSLVTTGREQRTNDSGEQYSVAPLTKGWDSAVVDDHSILSELKTPSDLYQFIKTAGYDLSQEWKEHMLSLAGGDRAMTQNEAVSAMNDYPDPISPY